jgi:hypothetical protein
MSPPPRPYLTTRNVAEFVKSQTCELREFLTEKDEDE